ncbi:NAD(P)/FAD-dependent oxidoreductase [Geodermatophilus sabuli]|uniref:2-polyprenyl-6-methoxyphenol hydroxylase n=1 Tax=Geodermatophilus sabuli TaxID=1564158 RepID=A0A285EB63_9ACTN|nr:FAD-dependent monooxygenase [Geodermatophilus sabuli]MBB3084364.1 2-polyprenyl-6-methoxyphenol hydroxylase-like FAD-dependent oxidoreductase [Geodermatophilus sabuli]SNX96368.1 2-polyprenyl-6-methoxyphenol hydroxylase [Geodermatophilus sabuli]
MNAPVDVGLAVPLRTAPTAGSGRLGGHAVVVGGSMTGLLAARVVSEHFSAVTVLDRDELPTGPVPRKAVPQGRHIHFLQEAGRARLEELFPGFTDEVLAAGGVGFDPGRSLVWHLGGGYVRRTSSPYRMLWATRPLFEWCVRRRVSSIGTVSVRSGCTVRELVASPSGDRVVGVEVTDGAGGGTTRLDADLVVDARGRGSAVASWLEQAGYGPVPRDEVRVGIGYSSRFYARESIDWDRAAIGIQHAAPDGRQGMVVPVEGDRWMVTLTGRLGNLPPSDDAGFLEFARTFAASDIHDAIRGLEPVSPIVTHRFPAGVRHRYERLPRFPERLIVMGDAIASYNPTYGQGISSAAMQATDLRRALGETGLEQLATRFFRRAARSIDIPWTVAVGGDFRFPATEGRKPIGTALTNRYLARLERGLHHDEEIVRAFGRVINLERPSSSLLHPRIVRRVLRAAA